MTSRKLAPAGRAIAAGDLKVVRRRYQDIEAQAVSIAGHRQTYTQLTRGQFEGRLESYAVSDRTAFFVETANQSIRKQFEVLPGDLRVGFLLGGFTCHGNGVPLITGDTSVNLSSTSLDLHFGETYRGCWVTLAEAEVAALTPPGKQLWTLAKAGRSQVRGAAGALFQQTIATAREALFKPDLPAPGPEVVGAIERSIVSAAAWAATTAFDLEAEPRRSCASHRTRLLRRACEVIDAKLSCGLTMSKLCSIIGTSRRTLENIFREAFGVSPYQYVCAVRLNAIRRELLADDYAGASIGDIAARWGVWHFSRFAADYRNMFGKLPSQERTSPCGSAARARTQQPSARIC
jgi:AraC family ethanolamine operon transcriptional activator